jgi:PIN domain nuclease of toxin-antitoxin system
MIVLDTHVLIWWVSDPEKLSKKARQAIDNEKTNGTIVISSISVWEIYLLVAKERIRLTMETDKWIEKITSLPYIQFIPVDNSIAAKSVLLPREFHNDPADRMIVATAREKGVVLITADERIKNYSYVQTLW